MKTAATNTSRAAYHQHKANGFAGQQAAILDVMRAGVLYSRRQIALMTQIETSTLSARMNELVACGKCTVAGSLRCPVTGINVQAVTKAGVQIEFDLDDGVNYFQAVGLKHGAAMAGRGVVL